MVHRVRAGRVPGLRRSEYSNGLSTRCRLTRNRCCRQLVQYATTETWTADLEDAYAIGPGHTQATGMAGLLTRVSWLEARKPLAAITTALSLHIVVVPSVFAAANYNLRQASRAIVLGSLLALLLTVVWQAVVFSSMPLSDHGPPLTAGRLVEGLRGVAGMSLPLFSLLALGGSMLGLGLGCVDWALDAARSVEGKGNGGLGRGEAVALVLAPCLFAAMLAPTHVHAASGLLRRSGIAGFVCGKPGGGVTTSSRRPRERAQARAGGRHCRAVCRGSWR